MNGDFFTSPDLVRYVAGWVGSFLRGLRLHLPSGIGARDTNAAKVRLAYMAARAVTLALAAEFPEFKAQLYETHARELADALRAARQNAKRVLS